MDVSVVDLRGSSTDDNSMDASNATRPLVWAAQQMPANWCAAESGRMLIVRGPPGVGADMSGGDLLAGLQSEESPAACNHMMGALEPRPSAFTPLTDSPATVRWVKEVMSRHREGKSAEAALHTMAAAQPEGEWDYNECDEGHHPVAEFQSLPLCRWVEGNGGSAA
jgi:hypothetical protein